MKLIDDILDFLGVQINKNAKKMYNDTIKSDNLSEKEIKSKIDEFAKSTIKATNKALNDIGIKQSISETENIIISDNITLSQNLYFRLNEVEQAATKTIKKHLKEQKTIKDLSLKIYQGYDFKKDDLNLKKTLPKYLFNEAVNLANKQKNKVKTKNLKTAYNQVLKAKSDEARNKALKIAMYEKGRFYANRIAQNEVNLEYMREKAKEILNNDDIETIAIKMSKAHPRTDICDYFSSVDLYGLGKGIYPKDKAPLPPFHPFCRCRLIPKFSESAKGAKLNKNAEKELIKSLAPYKQAQILGSKRRALEFLSSDKSMVEFYNESKPQRYKTRLANEPFIVNFKKLDFTSENISPLHKKAIEYWSTSHYTAMSQIANGVELKDLRRKNIATLKYEPIKIDEIFYNQLKSMVQDLNALFDIYAPNSKVGVKLYRGINMNPARYATTYANKEKGDKIILSATRPVSFTDKLRTAYYRFAYDTTEPDTNTKIIFITKSTGKELNIKDFVENSVKFENEHLIKKDIMFEIVSKKEINDRYGGKSVFITIKEVE